MSLGPLNRGTVEGADCASCPFSASGLPNRPVMSEFPDDPAWMIIGEGPGFNEQRLGRPFVGASGQVVDKFLARIRPRSEIFVGNATLCLPPMNSPVEDRERAASACSGRLKAELAQFPGKPILTLGAVAARAVIPKAALDAIDPPDVPKSKKRAAKDKQKAEYKETKKRRKAIDNILNRRMKKAIKHFVDKLFHETIRRYKRKPDRRYIDQEVAKVTLSIRRKIRVDAEAEYEALLRERALKKLDQDKAKPKKKKPIKITDIMGSAFEVDVDGSGIRVVIPGIHPAALLRGGGATIGGTHAPDLAYINLSYDAAKIDGLSRGKDLWLKLSPEIEYEDPKRAVELFLHVFWKALEQGSVSIDLETYVEDQDRHHALMAYVAKIRAIGFAVNGLAVSVMWDLLPGWTRSYLQVLLNRCSVGYHHGIYDVTVLRAQGFIIDKIDEDSLLAHHAAFPGCSHKLQQVTAQFYLVKPWKCLQADVKVLLPDQSTTTIQKFVKQHLPEVLSYEDGQIVTKRVVGWHEVRAPGQKWVAIKTDRCDGKYTRGLIVTPDHRVMTQRGLVEATDLIVGEDSIAIDEPTFSQDQMSAALGTLLGDSSLFVSRVYHHRPWDARRASLRGGHANEGLRDCKVAALGLSTSCKMTPAHTRMSKGAVINADDFFAYGTKWAYQYMDLARLVYDDNWRRRIKPEALEVLGRRGLAMMYMDDGDLHRTKQTIGAGFATNGFPLEDVELFAQWIRETYGATSVYFRKKKKNREPSPYCALSTAATKNMLEDLRGYIHPSVGYKTIHADEYKAVAQGVGIQHAKVLSVANAGRQRRSNHRYCLSVEDTKLFFTNYGLVSNSEFRNAEETPQGLTTYNAIDTGSTHALHPALALHVKRNKAERLYELDKKMASMGSRMHLAGMPVDREVNSDLLATFHRNLTESRAVVEDKVADPKIREHVWHHLAIQEAGKKRKLDPDDFEARYQLRLATIKDDPRWKWKINSGKHIAALLLAMGVQLTQKTDAGQISTKKDVLESLVDVPVVRDIVAFRENDKLYSTFVWPLFDREFNGQIVHYGYADKADRIHPIWTTHKISGRWASYDPVASNWAKDKWKRWLGSVAELAADAIYKTDEQGNIDVMTRPNLRRQIVAPKGRTFVGFDYAQLEAKIIALVSGDPFLLEVFATGLDIHTECAKVIFPNFAELSKTQQKKARNETKPLEYGAFYGGSIDTLWKQLLKEGRNVKRVDVERAVGKLMQKMAGVVAWQKNAVLKAMRPPHEVRDFILGRRRVFPLGNVEATEVMNYEAQASAAAIMNLGMAEIEVRLLGYKEAFPIGQFHDASLIECWEDDAEAIKKEVHQAFEQEYAREGHTIRFTVDSRIATNWAYTDA